MRRALLAALMLGTAGGAAANVLVVRAAGPSAATYRPGRSLPDNSRFTLRAGDSLTILASGGTRTFRGPGTFAASGQQSGGPQLAAGSDGRRARVGAVRDAGVIPHAPTIWDVDVSQSGTFCLTSTSNVMLWRPDASSPARFTLTGPAGPRPLAWAAGEPTHAWPRGVAIGNGATFTFAQAGVAVPVQITFRLLSTQPGDVQGVAQALIANGCQGQLDVLVDSQAQNTGS